MHKDMLIVLESTTYLSLSVENEKLFDKENRHIKLHDCQKVLTSHKNWIVNHTGNPVAT